MPLKPGDAMRVSYDLHTVVLSLLVACVSAYVAFWLAERIAENRGRWRAFWLFGGASAMGAGIWSMHFIGMLAYHLPVPIGYDIPTVVLSLLVAILASGVALALVSRAELSDRDSLIGGLLMGAGITAMHYVGMAAMRVAAAPRWDNAIVATSALIAIVASLVALRLVSRLRAVAGGRLGWRRVAAAAVMGSAVAGMQRWPHFFGHQIGVC
jgi:NO-binding membrane sensor protein with MHYT domain